VVAEAAAPGAEAGAAEVVAEAVAEAAMPGVEAEAAEAAEVAGGAVMTSKGPCSGGNGEQTSTSPPTSLRKYFLLFR
jgi:hypothetical protein